MGRTFPISGFVLAGGRSSRMGRDKALLELGGTPLVQRAVEKLRRICADVAILSDNRQLASFGPVVKDLHPDCGPMSGIEAALSHAAHDWSLIVPVDVPFLPEEFLRRWAQEALDTDCCVSLFRVADVPQPTILLIRKELGVHLSEAIGQGRYKLFPELQAAARSWAAARGVADGMRVVSQVNEAHFANLNTPEDFRTAEMLCRRTAET